MKKTTKKKIVEKMAALGVYKPEFDPTIERYVELTAEYATLYARYKNDAFACTVKTSQGEKKAPIVATLESLRRDMLNVEESLGLTPRGLLKLNEKAFEKPKKDRAGGIV